MPLSYTNAQQFGVSKILFYYLKEILLFLQGCITLIKSESKDLYSYIHFLAINQIILKDQSP